MATEERGLEGLAPDDLEALQEVWSLVDELGELSVRLQRAADGAIEAIEQKTQTPRSGRSGEAT